MLTKLYKKGKTVWSIWDTIMMMSQWAVECEVSSWLYCSYAVALNLIALRKSSLSQAWNKKTNQKANSFKQNISNITTQNKPHGTMKSNEAGCTRCDFYHQLLVKYFTIWSQVFYIQVCILYMMNNDSNWMF